MVDLLVAALLTAGVCGLGWGLAAALGAGLRRLGAFPAVPPGGPPAGYCPHCGGRLAPPACGL